MIGCDYDDAIYDDYARLYCFVIIVIVPVIVIVMTMIGY